MATLVPHYLTVTVTTAGTAVPILASTVAQPAPIVSCWIQAGNHDTYVGDSTISATGILLKAATFDKIQLTADANNALDLGKVYVDSSSNSGTVSVVYFTRV